MLPSYNNTSAVFCDERFGASLATPHSLDSLDLELQYDTPRMNY